MHLRVNGRSFTQIPISLESVKRRMCWTANKGCVGLEFIRTLMRQGFRFPSHTDWTKDEI